MDIVYAMDDVAAFIDGLSREEFFRDRKTQAAVTQKITVIGEATKRLSEEYRNRFPDIPWRKMAGMRDVIIHRYDQVDIAEVWEVITVDMPPVHRTIETMAPPRTRK